MPGINTPSGAAVVAGGGTVGTGIGNVGFSATAAGTCSGRAGPAADVVGATDTVVVEAAAAVGAVLLLLLLGEHPAAASAAAVIKPAAVKILERFLMGFRFHPTPGAGQVSYMYIINRPDRALFQYSHATPPPKTLPDARKRCYKPRCGHLRRQGRCDRWRVPRRLCGAFHYRI